MANLISTFGILVKQIALSLAPSIFTSSSVKQSISRSAILLCVFVVVHVAGNLSAIGGSSAFNKYAHMLHRNKAFIAVELYLMINVTVHAVMGVYKTMTNKYNRKTLGLDGGRFSAEKAQLILTGSLLATFLVVHVLQFRLAEKSTTEVDGVAIEDVYDLVTKTLESKTMAAAYFVGVVALGFHLWRGWSSAVTALDLGTQHRQNAILIGHTLTIAVCLGFVVSIGVMNAKLSGVLPREMSSQPEPIAIAGLVGLLVVSAPIATLTQTVRDSRKEP